MAIVIRDIAPLFHPSDYGRTPEMVLAEHVKENLSRWGFQAKVSIRKK